MVNAMFRRRAGVDAVVARETSDASPATLVLAHRSFLHRVAATPGGNPGPAPALSELGTIREFRGQPELWAGAREGS
jgi:hypothetical protein